MVRDADGAPVLIDFGSARIAAGERTNTQMVTDGYAPIEQYGRRKQGPPADLYALAAVSYRALFGERPPTAPDRVTNDTIARLEKRVNGAERGWLAALDRCLALQPKDRPQSVAALRHEIRTAPLPGDSPEVTEYRSRFQPPKSGRGMTLVEPLSPPYGAWEVRRWVGRRSSGALQAAVFAPTYGFRSDAGIVVVTIREGESLRLCKWDPSRADDSPLWEQEFNNESEAFAGLFQKEKSGAIEKAARERLRRELVIMREKEKSSKRSGPPADRRGKRNETGHSRRGPTTASPAENAGKSASDSTSLGGVRKAPDPSASGSREQGPSTTAEQPAAKPPEARDLTDAVGCGWALPGPVFLLLFGILAATGFESQLEECAFPLLFGGVMVGPPLSVLVLGHLVRRWRAQPILGLVPGAVLLIWCLA